MPKVSLEYMQNIDKIYSPQWKRTHLLGDQGGREPSHHISFELFEFRT